MSDLSAALARWAECDGGLATLINLSENHTFRIDPPEGEPVVLRVHRPGYHSRGAIESELAWMEALRADAGLFTPRPLSGRNGDLVQSAPFRAGPDRHPEQRFMVLFAFESGAEPEAGEDLEPIFIQLGALAARCHGHAAGWRRPEGFVRQTWSADAILDADGIWGDWRRGPGVEGPARAVLDRLDAVLRADLAAYGRGADRFGLIHADMRMANLLVHGGETRLIDFDDSGFGWFGYDFAAAVSFFEDSPDLPALRAAWLEGYGRHRRLTAEDIGALDALVLLRRMALLAWIGSHAETGLAQEQAPHFAAGAVEMAERYLSRGTIDR